MSKRKRKNSIEVLENMREKDKEKVNDMKIKEMIAQEEIIEMAENMGDSLEDVEALREAMNEEVYNQMDRVDKINEAKEMLEMVVKVNAGIKYAVKSIENKVEKEQLKTIASKFNSLVKKPMSIHNLSEDTKALLKTNTKIKADKVIELLSNVSRYRKFDDRLVIIEEDILKVLQSKDRGITLKQIDAISKTYKQVVGKELLPVQTDFLKKCSEEQAKRVIYTLNVAKKTLVNA